MVKKYLIYILYDIVGSLFIGISLHCFTIPSNFAPGGVTGLSVIGNHFINISIGLLIIIINIPIIFLTYRKLKIEFLLCTLKSIIISSLLLDFLICYFPLYVGNRLVSTLFAGFFAGIGYSLFFNADSSTGGTDLIVAYLKKIKPNLSYGFLVFFIDILVIILYTIVFHRFDALLYGLIYTIFTSICLDLTTMIIKSVNKVRIKD